MSSLLGRDIVLSKLLSPSVTLTGVKQTLASLQIKAGYKTLRPLEVSGTISGKAPRAQCSGRLANLAQTGNR